MKTQYSSKKSSYKAPEIVCIQLDNEISLQLESTPPVGPDESALYPEYLNNNAFKPNLG